LNENLESVAEKWEDHDGRRRGGTQGGKCPSMKHKTETDHQF